MELTKDDIEIATPMGAFWIERKENSEKILEIMKKDYEKMPMLMKFQEEVIRMCEAEIKKEEVNNE